MTPPFVLHSPSTVLVVHQDRDTVQEIEAIIGTAGWQSSVALSGTVAVDAARTDAPALVLAGTSVSDMSLEDLCRAFKADALLTGIPIVAMVAEDQASRAGCLLRCGARDFVTLPARPAELVSRIECAVLQREPAGANRSVDGQMEGIPNNDRGKALLVVEDDERVSRLIARTLEEAGYEVAGMARSADQAVQMAHSVRVDLVLMDIALRGNVDGIETGRRLRTELNLPIVFITGRADPETLQKARAVEPLGYLVKPFSAGALEAAVGTAFQQIEARSRERRTLASEVEERYQLVLDRASIGYFQSTPEGRIVIASPALARILGYDSPAALLAAVTDVGLQLYADPTRRGEFMRRLMAEGSCRGVEAELVRKDGRAIWVSANAFVSYEAGAASYYGTVEDITERRVADHERKMMEIQLRNAQKLEAIGQLAAGIAHEINTPIQYVGDNTRFLDEAFRNLARVGAAFLPLVESCRQVAPTLPLLDDATRLAAETDLAFLVEEVPTAICHTLEGIGRVSQIVKAMKEFSHPGTDEKRAVSLNRAIESTATVSRNEWKYVADLTTDLDDTLPDVPCLPGEVNQVLLNLIVNAAHAIADVVRQGEKGRITIRTRHVASWAVIEVADTGGGIPDSIRHRVFEPFFTTKGIGKGTGQGLALAHAIIVNQHGGTIDFAPAEGGGTTFTVRLPLAPAGEDLVTPGE
jgi:two-component system, NtrC family, sensor kinase